MCCDLHFTMAHLLSDCEDNLARAPAKQDCKVLPVTPEVAWSRDTSGGEQSNSTSGTADAVTSALNQDTSGISR